MPYGDSSTTVLTSTQDLHGVSLFYKNTHGTNLSVATLVVVGADTFEGERLPLEKAPKNAA